MSEIIIKPEEREAINKELRKDGSKLALVDPEYRDLEFCRIAVKETGFALKWVPNEVLENNEDLIILAIENKKSKCYFPSQYWGKSPSEKVLESACTHGYFKEVPKDMLTDKMIDLACKYTMGYKVFDVLPPDQQTFERYRMIIRGIYLHVTPEHLQTHDNYKFLLEETPRRLQFLPAKFHCDEFDNLCFSKDASCIEFIKNPTTKMISDAVKTFPHYIKKIKNPSVSICRVAIRKGGVKLVQYLPEEILSHPKFAVFFTTFISKQLEDNTIEICELDEHGNQI